jgi:23S rRNA pseudouridine1911/1915/1917 synthase
MSGNSDPTKFRATSGGGRIVHHVTNEDTTLSRCLHKHFGLNDDKIGELIRLGAVYSNRLRLLEDRKLVRGSYLRIHLQPKRFPIANIDWAAVIVHEERDFLVVNKPAGIPVHATLDNRQDNLLQQLRDFKQHPLLVTQRLDVGVSGLMVIAKTPEFQRCFNLQLANRTVQKRYVALSQTKPGLGNHVHFMEPSERSPKRISAEEKPQWLRCELTVHHVAENALLTAGLTYFESKIELMTGRTHQIRAQLSALGSPIVADKMYGSKYTPEFIGAGDSIGLCSVSLGWPKSGKGLKGQWQFQAPARWKTPGNKVE